jgi:hypothetical protein
MVRAETIRKNRRGWEDNNKMDHKKQAQDRDQWRALVKLVIIVQVTYRAENFLPNLTTQGELCGLRTTRIGFPQEKPK